MMNTENLQGSQTGSHQRSIERDPTEIGATNRDESIIRELTEKGINPTSCSIVDPQVLTEESQCSQETVEIVVTAVKRVFMLYHLFGLTLTPSDENAELPKGNFSSLRKKDQKTLIDQVAANMTNLKTVRNILNYCKEHGEGSWVKLLKYKFAAFFSERMNGVNTEHSQDIPPKPYIKRKGAFFSNPSVLLGGRCNDKLNSLKRSDPNKYIEFIVSTLYLKKCMPAVSDLMIEQAEDDAVKALTGDYNIIESVEFEVPKDTGVEKMHIKREEIQFQIHRTVSELFSESPLSLKILMDVSFPSTSSNYIRSRAGLGACGHLKDQEFVQINGSELGRDEINISQTLVYVYNKVSKTYGLRGQHEQQILDMYKGQVSDLEVARIVDFTQLEALIPQYVKYLYDQSKLESPICQALGLAEPLKIRVISKGPPIIYTFEKPIQKFLWSTLKRNKTFNLIGQPVTEADINELFQNMLKDEIIVSGDYKASTDNLKKWATEQVIDSLFELWESNPDQELLTFFGLDFYIELKKIFKKSLIGHIFEHRKKLLPQTNGQLMGSILSFPILCIVNAALCRFCMEIAGSFKDSWENGEIEYLRLADKKFLPRHSVLRRLRLANLKVNGDDNVFRGPKWVRVIWENVCALAGLESSVGKTYFSNQFCTINSLLYLNLNSKECFDQGFVFTGKWTAVRYLNLGLFYGIKRSSSDSRFGMTIDLIGSKCRYLKDNCPVSIWPQVKKQFIRANTDILKASRLSWFLPEWLGGLGLPIDDFDREVSAFDRKIATCIKRNYHKNNFCPVSIGEATEWQTHRLVKKVFGLTREMESYGKNFEFNNIIYDVEETYNQFYKRAVLYIFFTQPLESLHIINKSGDRQVRQAIKRNEQIISRCSKEIERNHILYPEMTLEDMQFEQKKLFPLLLQFNNILELESLNLPFAFQNTVDGV